MAFRDDADEQRRIEEENEKEEERKREDDLEFQDVYDDLMTKLDRVFAIPWGIFATILVAGDIYNNVFENRFWAGGNLFLILNSLYGYFQYFMSLALAFESTNFLRSNRFLRIWTLFSSVIYNAIWTSFLLKLFDIVLNW